MTENNITPFQHRIEPTLRAKINGHKPVVLWFTGLSGSGKSSIASQLEKMLVNDFHAHTSFLDGDSIRSRLNKDLGFSASDRIENIRRIGEVARLMYTAGLIVLVSIISPFKEDRNKVRALFPKGDFWEIFVDCPLEICMARDPKKLYERARNGNITNFTGLTSPYEFPENPEIILDSNEVGIIDCAKLVLEQLLEKDVLQS